mmetsp:Transcript_32618/g.58882  ORF Transcript_32618/g.58882 Transcript_32618/m.58882 type:complete len:83 (-) Transcript_32618:1408-1656(-)
MGFLSPILLDRIFPKWEHACFELISLPLRIDVLSKFKIQIEYQRLRRIDVLSNQSLQYNLILGGLGTVLTIRWDSQDICDCR